MTWDFMAMSKGALKVFRVFGRMEFVKRLQEFFADGGRKARAEALANTAKVVRDLEETKAIRVQRLNTLVSLLKDAGFSPKEIQAKIEKEDDIEGVLQAFDTLLRYVESGQITVEAAPYNVEEESRQVIDEAFSEGPSKGKAIEVAVVRKGTRLKSTTAQVLGRSIVPAKPPDDKLQ